MSSIPTSVTSASRLSSSARELVLKPQSASESPSVPLSESALTLVIEPWSDPKAGLDFRLAMDVAEPGVKNRG